ncbi:MAG: SusD/RagB family nutrient-binding outer membrane lipoprotein [Bacteroidales bacterium]|nr:SusD/RagB family nutrient-binding outer membrane lipoprotein [Bacteroidales bacterium]
MKKIVYIGIIMLVSVLGACTTDLTDINHNPNQVDVTNPNPAFLGSEKFTIDFLCKSNYQNFWFYSRMMTSSNNFNPTNYWSEFYTSMLPGLKEIQKTFGNDPAFNNRVQVAKIWECYIWSIMVQSFGPIPKSKAMLAGTDPNDNMYGTQDIMCDTEDSIYLSILQDLKKAAKAIDVTKSADKYTSDAIFKGDNSKWIKFANTLRLRLALTLDSCDSFVKDTAIVMIRELMQNESALMTSNNDNAAFQYGVATGSECPYWSNYLNKTFTIFMDPGGSIPTGGPKLHETLFTYFRNLSDPRIDAYFQGPSVITYSSGGSNRAPWMVTDTLLSTLDALHHVVTYPCKHVGSMNSSGMSAWSLPGSSFSGSDWQRSQPHVALINKDHAFTIMTYAETCFLKSEAAFSGFAGTNTTSAQTYYEAGIDAAMSFWKVPTKEVTAYKQVDGVKWGTTRDGFRSFISITDTDIKDDITKIRIQRWINYYLDQGFDAWVLQRRTRVLENHPIFGSLSADPINYPNITWAEMPERLDYTYTGGSAFATLNPLGYADGIAKLGGPNAIYVPLLFSKPSVAQNWAALRPVYNYKAFQKWYGTTVQELDSARAVDGFTYTSVKNY